MLLSSTLLLVAATLFTALPNGLRAASHREAPLIALDPGADISDFFMFRSYEPGKADNVVLMMNVVPGQEPSSGRTTGTSTRTCSTASASTIMPMASPAM
ncbi:DUF4331 domain-containing protein [Candidatus Gracilibacteria bacterium]|nr:DUF4331 domain-containing protein [Candidatus Gracilibacteria bacterium]